MAPRRIGIVDTGVNPWHSHVRGVVNGCRIRVGRAGTVEEDGDFADAVGHGTAVAGVIREGLPDAEIFAIRAFETEYVTYPSLIARGILRAASAGCAFVNLSLAVPPGPGAAVVAAACAAAIDAGCVLVAALPPDGDDWLPASVHGVYGVTDDDSLARDAVRVLGPRRLAAPGRPRDLALPPWAANFAGPSFACARALVHLAREARSSVRLRRARPRASSCGGAARFVNRSS